MSWCPVAVVQWMVTGLLGSVAGQLLSIAAAAWRWLRPGALRYGTRLRFPLGLFLVCLSTLENIAHTHSLLYHTQVSLAGGIVALADDVSAARRHHGVAPRGTRREEEWFFYQLLVERVVERHVVQDALQFVRSEPL